MIEKNIILSFKYTFSKDGKIIKQFNINLDRNTLDFVFAKKKETPDWALLKLFKCPNCPLDEEKQIYCPLAEKMEDFVDFFRNSHSFEEVDIKVETETRTYMKKTRLQYGIAALMGLIMPASGCPVLAKLKPMARFHLPFASIQETTFRAMSTYLLGQYFLLKKNHEPDWALKNLVHFYKDIQIVNKNIWNKWSDIIKDEASANALVILDTFADFVLLTVDDITVSEIEQLFNVYMENPE